MNARLAARCAAPCLLALLLAAAGDAADAPTAPAFGAAFGSGMVLPHGESLVLSGTAARNAPLTLQVAGRTYQLRSDARGAWRQRVDPLGAGGPYTLSLTDAAG